MPHLMLRTVTSWDRSTDSAAFRGEISELRPGGGGALWTPTWDRQREYLWQDSRDISLSADFMKCVTEFSTLCGWDSPW